MRNERLITLAFIGLLALPLAGHGDEDHAHEAPPVRLAAADHDHEDEHGHDEAHGHEDEGHGHDEAGEHEEGVLRLDAEARAAQGIELGQARLMPLKDLILAPAEVIVDAYRAARVTPRIPGQITARHARLGDHVRAGDRLATLSSVEMARAQGDLLVADREWQRVKALGKQVVSERRWVEARVARQLALARVRAYGMTEAQIEALLRQGDVSRATGDFDLIAPISGTVISDDFILGELAEPGRVMFDIADETVLWVEARLHPEVADRIAIGASARVSPGKDLWIEGRVVQRHHRLDEATRTQAIRIEVNNADDRLHPGQFVQAVIESAGGEPVVAVPESAVVLMQGSPVVFRLEGEDELHPQPVETGATRAGWTEIRAGLAAGETVVVRGAFFLKSLLLKSQMGEGHAH